MPTPSHAAAAKDKLQKVETELNQGKKTAARLDEKVKAEGDTLSELRHRLIASTEALEGKVLEQSRLEDKLDNLQDEIDAKKSALVDQKKKLRIFTIAIVELARQPVETLFLQTGLTTDYVRRSILIRALIPHLKEEVVLILRDIATLNDMQADLVAQQKVIKAERNNLAKQQQDLDQLIKTRQGILQKTESQKTAMMKQLASLSSEAKDLRQLLDRITPKHSAKSPLSNPSLRLKWPVSGTVVHRFGERDADGVTSQGITFSALPGSPVVSPQPGKVVFAGPFRGYGQILILQHAGGYHSFLAGFGRIDADVGQDVETGEPLGVLPATGARRTELYFEWRHNSEPVDPTGGITLSKSP